MNDKEFQQLRRQIHKKMVELLVLQRLHRNETGRDYVISGPLPEPEVEVILSGQINLTINGYTS